MKFYNREPELVLLDHTRDVAFNNHSQMTVLTGRKDIGSWWESSKGKDVDQNEIDIIAISAESPIVFIAEVKRQRKNFKPELFQQKVEAVRTKLFFKYEIETACLTLEDMSLSSIITQ